MTVYTVTLDAEVFGTSGFSLVGTPSPNTKIGALNDADNNTYVQKTSNTVGAAAAWGITNWTIPAGEVVKRVRWKLTRTASVSGASKPILAVSFYSETTGNLTAFTNYTTAATNQVETGPWHFTSPNGGTWGQSTLNTTSVYTYDYTGTAAVKTQIKRIQIEIETSDAPTVSGVVTAPATPITNDLTPNVSWTYSDSDGDPQNAFQVKVFTQAQWSAGGFSPTTAVGTYDFVGTGSGTTHTITQTLPSNETDMRVYVRANSIPSGSTLSAQWSSWAFYQFTTAVAPPATVDIARVDSGSFQTYTIKGRRNELTDAYSTFESSIGGLLNASNATGIVRDNSYGAFHGTYYGVYNSSAAGASIIRPSAQTGAAVPGDIRSATARLSTFGLTRNARLGIYWFGANTTTWGSSTSIVTLPTWTEVRIDNAVAPASTTGWTWRLEFTANAGSESIFFDAVSAHVNGPGLWSGPGYTNYEYKIVRSTNESLLQDWRPLTGTQQEAYFDLFAARGVNNGIKVKTRGVHSDSGVTIESDWVTSTGTPATANDWQFKTNDPVEGLLFVAQKVTASDATVNESKGVFYPLGANKAVVVGGSIFGIDGTYTVVTTTQAEYDNLMKFVKASVPVLVQDPWGDQKWCRFIERGFSESNTQAKPIRTFNLQYVEVDEPTF